MRILKIMMATTAALALTACSASEAKPESNAEASHPTHSHDAEQNINVPTHGPLAVPSGNYTMDKTHGYVTFSYLHKGLSHPQLRFNDVDATLVLDAENPENSQITVTIQAANIDSGVAKFDDHLNSPDFFNSAVNPKITFTSTSFTRASATTGTMRGELSMMGVSKTINFDVELIGTAEGEAPAIGVEGRTKLLRSEFGLGKYVPYVGDEVSITISAEFHKNK
ncbi:MAG: YceI family protein [Robiginitomaculum sp.]|nr:YceI family protein [Robiginitomaculum sp.]